LGANVYGNYYPNMALSILNYISIVAATIIYSIVLLKFYQDAKKTHLAKLREEMAPVARPGV
jgi:hypothetical protein